MPKREFTAESRLGFLRVIQVVSIIMMVTMLFTLLFVTGHRLRLTFGLISTLVQIVSLGVTIWLIGTRREHTRVIVPALIGVDIVFSGVSQVLSGVTSPLSLLTNQIPNILLIVYFLTSRRAKAVLVRPFSDFGVERGRARQAREMWNLKSPDFWLRMLIYFFVFCVVGHWMEAGFCMLVKLGIAPGEVAPDDSIQFRDYLNPFYIYGLGFCMCGLIFYPLKEWLLKKLDGKVVPALVVSFLVNMLFVAVVELIMGEIVNRDFSVWDYRNQPFNLAGQICLVYSLLFALVATVVTWLLYPALESALGRLRPDTLRVVFVVALILFIILIATYGINFQVDELDSAFVADGTLRA